MDPNETLTALRRLACVDSNPTGPWTPEYANARCQRYAELIEALDNWITGGGFLPEAWRKVRSVTVTGDDL